MHRIPHLYANIPSASGHSFVLLTSTSFIQLDPRPHVRGVFLGWNNNKAISLELDDKSSTKITVSSNSIRFPGLDAVGAKNLHVD